ncbi:MAG: hypothetical protein J0M07_11280, partial [Anaerolineae bacterium]|nr:hypothetical protein [Anaerolineae bacterium]
MSNINYSYTSCSKESIQLFLLELENFLNLSAVAMFVLSINSQDSPESNEFKIPPGFFQLFFLSCSELRLSYSCPADVPNQIPNAQRNPNASRQQKSCEMTILVNNAPDRDKKYTIRFRPDDFPQKVYFEERLNRDLVEGSKRVLAEVYRCHKSIPQVVYFKRLARSCSERFNVFLTVELIPRSDNELRCVYRRSNQDEFFSTTVRLLQPNLFISSDHINSESTIDKLFMDLRAWYLTCGDHDLGGPFRLSPLIHKISDNGVIISEPPRATVSFSDHCPLSRQ